MQSQKYILFCNILTDKNSHLFIAILKHFYIDKQEVNLLHGEPFLFYWSIKLNNKYSNIYSTHELYLQNVCNLQHQDISWVITYLLNGRNVLFHIQ